MAFRLTTSDSQNVRFGIITSVVVHVLLLLLLAWNMGLNQAARRLLSVQARAKEEPTVALLFPEQVIPTAALRPRLDTKPFIRSTQASPEVDKPAKSDFVSDHNTKAASSVAPFPDGDTPMPSSLGGDRATHQLVNQDFHAGEKPSAPGGNPPAPAPALSKAEPATATVPPPPAPVTARPSVTPLAPHEPSTVPQVSPKEIAKADAPTVAKMMEEMDKESGRLDVTKLPIEVKKAEFSSILKGPTVPAPPQGRPVETPPARPPMPWDLQLTHETKKDAPADYSPMTRTAKVKGTISNKGEAAVDAEATPNGRYTAKVTAAVEKTWNEFYLRLNNAVPSGYLRVTFYVNREGHVEDLHFLEKSGNAETDSFTLDAILHAQIAPIPRDLLPFLEDERILVEYDIIIQ